MGQNEADDNGLVCLQAYLIEHHDNKEATSACAAQPQCLPHLDKLSGAPLC
jgi:hypothetical protein